MSWRRAAILWLVGTLALAAPSAALADGDPASDVLLGQNVFYPYTPAVTASLQQQLNATTAAAHAAGFPLKVALIASPVDLGAIPDLFGKPQPYASFLDQEISFQTKQPLLVVMAAGYGVQGVTPAARAAVASLPMPAGKGSDGLARAALVAVPALARAAGHPLATAGPKAALPRSSGAGGGRTILLIALTAAAVAVAGALIVLRRRRARP